MKNKFIKQDVQRLLAGQQYNIISSNDLSFWDVPVKITGHFYNYFFVQRYAKK